MELVIVTLTGLAIGSFLNVILSRTPNGESLGGRSRCANCKHNLRAIELLPLLSFFIQKRKCNYCGEKISWQYPFVEGFTGASFFAVWFFFHPTLKIISLFYFLAILTAVSTSIVIVLTDIHYQIIPNGASLAFFVAGLAMVAVRFSTNSSLWFYDISSAVFISLFIFFLWFLSKGNWMGLGDAKLILGTSLFLGFPQSLAAISFAFWTGGITAIFLLVAGLFGPKSRIPFAPFIILGSIIAFFYTPLFTGLLGYPII